MLELDYDLPADSQAFDKVLNTCAARIDDALKMSRKLVFETLLECKICEQILEKFCESSTGPKSAMHRKEELEKNLKEYMELLHKPHPPLKKITGIPRYLRAFGFRVQFACNKPLRYDSQARSIHDLKASLASMRSMPGAAFPHTMKMLDEFELMIEEYCIIAFANGQVPVAFPVSEQRIKRAHQEVLQALEDCCDFAQTS